MGIIAAMCCNDIASAIRTLKICSHHIFPHKMKTRCLPKRRAKASSISPPRPRILFASSGDTQSVSGSPTSNRKEFTEHLWRQLAEDIEAEGGIAAFVGSSQKLAFLLNQRPDLYGNRGDEIREPIRKKVYRWQQFNKENTYANKVLSKYQVKSAFHRKQEELQKRKSLSSGGKKNETKSVVQNSTPGRLPYRQPNNKNNNKTTATRRSTPSAEVTAAFVDKEDNDSYSLSSSSLSSSGNSGGSSIHSVASIPQQQTNKKPRLQRRQKSSEVDDLLSLAVASLLNISSTAPSSAAKKRKSPPSSKTLVQSSPSRPAQQIKMPPTKVPAGKKLPDGTGTTIDSWV